MSDLPYIDAYEAVALYYEGFDPGEMAKMGLRYKDAKLTEKILSSQGAKPEYEYKRTIVLDEYTRYVDSELESYSRLTEQEMVLYKMAYDDMCADYEIKNLNRKREVAERRKEIRDVVINPPQGMMAYIKRAIGL